jgi:OmpA-OmpF porin, OOP family
LGQKNNFRSQESLDTFLLHTYNPPPYRKNLKNKVFIVGHTENIGGIDCNIKLSQARAGAVMKALITKYKVNPQSMKAYWVGQLAPVAPNKTEEGRAKNRRVELVEQ